MKFHLPSSMAALLLAGLAASGTASAALFERSTNDLQTEVRSAAANGRQLAVLLTMPDCPGCREMEKKVFHNAALEKTFAAQFASARVDITQESSLIEPSGKTSSPAQWATRLHAVGTPSFVFLDKQGQVLYRYTGALTAKDFRQLTKYVAGGHYEHHPFQPSASGRASPAAQTSELHTGSAHQH
ncbi:thioredoxin fold domain-containing protein [Zoogloea sp. LCSB751]|uniref:thioredoxin family protein n=1 Tax=Zoogloea sp. LCSB751 TaxID=1965277 RepID=UPI0009A4D2F0|nr:thioredoxin fold domain-containing protein [Zoogloea sp. LCSB751]